MFWTNNPFFDTINKDYSQEEINEFIAEITKSKIFSDMAKLSKETRSTLSQQKEQLLDLIDEAKLLEFLLLENRGENLETTSTLEQLTEIAEQARTRLSQLSTLHLRVAEVQPTIPDNLLRLMNEAITNIQNRIAALERSLEEINLDWRLK
ncbi:hypothetical protein [Gloeothece verrucosa]|uniref:Uncharacterized protein n=1 Tax=Gloeothece verrucosa (strain PCC 7822) TaxID=497965 RepID=E0UN75_GLOV7|nr:hypothetical protein [Gloeothece verrucosa]ADN18405.1 hypothetical protein Cyan7822_6729 [Gloeothece verrucosa PCC 7822]